MTRWTVARSLLTVSVPVLLAGCSDGGNDPPDGDPLVIQKTVASSGDGQTANVGEALPLPLRIVITRASEPEEGVEVDWTTANGGTLAPATATSDADGVATATWTLGPNAGTQTATATVAGATGSPLTFSAIAEDEGPPAGETIQVLGPAGGNRFSPATVTIAAGETVTWVWPSGSVNHNVQPDGTQPSSSGPLADGPRQYEFTFDTPGTYNFFCQAHGGAGGSGMSGQVTVTP